MQGGPCTDKLESPRALHYRCRSRLHESGRSKEPTHEAVSDRRSPPGSGRPDFTAASSSIVRVPATVADSARGSDTAGSERAFLGALQRWGVI